jgi:hypothetical protein
MYNDSRSYGLPAEQDRDGLKELQGKKYTMAIDEIIYFSGQGVEVNNARFTVGETTYSISYIESVEEVVEEKSKVKLKTGPIIMGVILMLMALLSIVAAINTNETPLIVLIILFGIASAFMALAMFNRSYVTRKTSINHLILTTKVDKYDAFQTADNRLFREVVEALNNAVADRDFI